MTRSEGIYFPRNSAPDGYKHCSACKELKPIEEFHKNGARYDGIALQCKPCRKSSTRWYHLKRLYGLTREEYEFMYSVQEGRCAICNLEQAVLCVDHDHDTGHVRALLCNSCNVFLAHAAENRERLRAAIKYLEAFDEGA